MSDNNNMERENSNSIDYAMLSKDELISHLQMLESRLEERERACKTAAEMGMMLIEKNNYLIQSTNELQRKVDSFTQQLTTDREEYEQNINEMENKNRILDGKYNKLSQYIKDLENENEEYRQALGAENQYKPGNGKTSDYQTVLKDLEKTQAELSTIKAEFELCQKANNRLVNDKEERSQAIMIAEDRISSLEEDLKLAQEELQKSQKLAASELSHEEIQDLILNKQQSYALRSERDTLIAKVKLLSEVNESLRLEYQQDRALMESFKRENLLMREALEEKELQFMSDGGIDNNNTKSSLLTEIERDLTSSKFKAAPGKNQTMMDMVKQDFEQLAMRVYRLRHKLEQYKPLESPLRSPTLTTSRSLTASPISTLKLGGGGSTGSFLLSSASTPIAETKS